MSTDGPRAHRARPYFLPETIDFDALPEAVKTALDTIVQPVYEELVLAEVRAMERAMGITIVFLLTEELFDQFELGRLLINDGSTPRVSGAERETMLRGHLRLVGAKQSAIHALLRIRRFAEEHATTESVQTTRSEPVASEPVASEPVESEPVESEPVESEPVESEPVESEPVESEPVESEPVESEAAA